MNIAALVLNTIAMLLTIVALVRQRANTKRMDRLAAMEGKVKS